jgi:thermitase
MELKQAKYRNLKIVAISFMASGALVLATQAFKDFMIDGDDNTDESALSESIRMTSLGTPQVLPVDKSKGEQKVIMNDPSIQKNWGLMGHLQSDIKASNAWEITTGDRRIVVAVIDTGIDVNHPDLAENLWVNPGETGLDAKGRDKATNGIDDDGDGYIDDVHGYDFANNTGKLIDNHGHGTHIAGIIGAVGGNSIGISGVCPKVSLMILKYFDPTSKGNDNLKNTVRAIRYAVKMGANVINYSGGGIEPNEDEFSAIKYAQDNGVLVIAAAGNEHSNSDVTHYYPADYNLSNIISVTAIDSLAHVLKSSNFGMKSVHIAAPGEGIYSTLPGGNYGLMTGTSQATAFVTGVAALILAHNKDFKFDQVKKQILATADEMPGLRDKTSTSGKLNSYAALAMQPAIPATGIASAGTQHSQAGIIDHSETHERAESNHNLLSLVNAINGRANSIPAAAAAQNPNRRGASQAPL